MCPYNLSVKNLLLFFLKSMASYLKNGPLVTYGS